MTVQVVWNRSGDLGRAARVARRQRRWTQARLARLARVGRGFIGKLEAGDESLRISKAMGVLMALDLRPVIFPRRRKVV